MNKLTKRNQIIRNNILLEEPYASPCLFLFDVTKFNLYPPVQDPSFGDSSTPSGTFALTGGGRVL